MSITIVQLKSNDASLINREVNKALYDLDKKITGISSVNNNNEELLTLEQSGSFMRQTLLNGDFYINQETTSSVTTDGAYVSDVFAFLRDSNGSAQYDATDIPSCKLTSGGSRLGIVQFIENKNTIPLRGKNISISLRVKSSNIPVMSIAVLYWTGTADAPTKDVVSSWGTTPTLVSSWNYAKTPIGISVSNNSSVWNTIQTENITIPITANNIAVFIFTPNSEISGDIIYVTDVCMNVGSKALPFVKRDYADELCAVQRWLDIRGNAAGTVIISDVGFAPNYGGARFNFKNTYVKIPSISKSGTISVYDGSGTGVTTTITLSDISSSYFTVHFVVPTTVYRPAVLVAAAGAYLKIDARF